MIFVSVASYRDPMLPGTIQDLRDKAENPGELVFGVCHQYGEEAPEYVSSHARDRVTNVPAETSKGCCWARSSIWEKLKSEMNRDDYVFQVDSHMRFEKGWDTALKSQLNLLPWKSILSSNAAYWSPPSRYVPYTPPVGRISCVKFEADGRILQRATASPKTDVPKPSALLTACCLFTRPDWVREVPYDPEIFFIGEEISLAIRSWTRGWNIYSPCDNVSYHRHERDYRKTVFEDHRNWSAHDARGLQRTLEVMGVRPRSFTTLKTFVNGDVRSMALYEKFAGISFKTREIAPFALVGDVDEQYLY